MSARQHKDLLVLCNDGTRLRTFGRRSPAQRTTALYRETRGALRVLNTVNVGTTVVRLSTVCERLSRVSFVGVSR